MKVRVNFTVDVDYQQWAKIRNGRGEVSAAACRNNICSLAEEAFDNAMEDYVDFAWL